MISYWGFATQLLRVAQAVARTPMQCNDGTGTTEEYKTSPSKGFYISTYNTLSLRIQVSGTLILSQYKPRHSHLIFKHSHSYTRLSLTTWRRSKYSLTRLDPTSIRTTCLGSRGLSTPSHHRCRPWQLPLRLLSSKFLRHDTSAKYVLMDFCRGTFHTSPSDAANHLTVKDNTGHVRYCHVYPNGTGVYWG